MKKSFLMAGLFAALLVFTVCQQAVPDPKEMLDIKPGEIEWSEGVWKFEGNSSDTNSKYSEQTETSISYKIVKNAETGFLESYRGNDAYYKTVYVYNDAETYNSEKNKNVIYGAGTTVEYDDATLTITKTTVPTDDFTWASSRESEVPTSYFQDLFSYCEKFYVKQSRDKTIVYVEIVNGPTNGTTDSIYTFTKQ